MEAAQDDVAWLPRPPSTTATANANQHIPLLSPPPAPHQAMRRPLSVRLKKRLSAAVRLSFFRSRGLHADAPLDHMEETGSVVVSEIPDGIHEPLGHDPPASSQLPLELWAEILAYLPSTDLASIASVCMLIRGEAERRLYRSISLTDNTIILFHRTIAASPRHGSLVRRLDAAVYNSFLDERVPIALANIFNLQLDLHYLSLCFSRGAIWNHTVVSSCQYILRHPFPNLRGFRTNMSLMVLPQLMSYIYSQANLEELHLEMDDLIPPNMALPPSLRTFTVFPRLRPGTFREQDLTRITHLCLGRYGFEHFDNLAGPTVGAHLVSLRLGSRLGGTSWSLGEVAARFPCLRLLHVDMGKHINGPAMHPCPIDWRSKKREQLPHHDGEPHPPVGTSGALTVVWAYPHEDGVVLASAVKWHMFLNEVAFVVLRRWSPYVGRIVYRHTIIPYVCATLSHDQTRLIREKDVYMPDDYWKTV
ncbi:hypothetical protein C2E23DRAFT_576634 [Lenzites betulinus]|nr:hypothetical protein C2E23DRAFT_576634 [Lenzites betulinus]